MITPEYYPIELLYWAGMEEKYIPIIEDILEFYPEYINTTNNQKDNALIVATRLNNIEIVKYFLEKTNIDYNHISNEGNFFMVAIKYNHKKLVKLLLTDYKDKLDLNSKTLDNKTFLHLCAQKGFDFIFENKELCKDYIYMKDINEQNCLFDLFDEYNQHQNYWCFDLIQEYFSKEQIEEKNKDNLNIFQYFFQKRLIELITTKNRNNTKFFINENLKEEIINKYTPILNVLEQRV